MCIGYPVGTVLGLIRDKMSAQDRPCMDCHRSISQSRDDGIAGFGFLAEINPVSETEKRETCDKLKCTLLIQEG